MSPAMSDVPGWLERLAEGSIDEITLSDVGTLTITSGELIACDPAFFRDAAAFALDVPKGSHPVSLGRMGGDNAFALLRFSKKSAIRWDVARCPGDEDIEGWPGYAVDSGIGCFVDATTVDGYLEREDAIQAKVALAVLDDGVDLTDPIAYATATRKAREKEGPDPIADLALGDDHAQTVVIDPESGGAMIAFRTGAEEGVFASFWGFDDEGEPVCIVTDYGLLEPPLDDEDDDDLEDDDLDDDLGLDAETAALLEAELDARDLGEAPRRPASSPTPAEPSARSELAGLEALAAALMGGEPEEEEERQGPSPLFVQTKDLLMRWVDEEKLELEDDVNVDAFAEALLEKLIAVSGHRNPGRHLAEWLLERNEVADVFASDDEIEADLRPR